MIVSALYQYPIKSCAGVSLPQMQFDRLGPIGDRRFMLVNANGKFISQRTHGQMALIQVHYTGKGDEIELSCAGRAAIKLQPLDVQANLAVQVWGDEVQALDIGEQAASYLSDFLAESVRLVYFGRSSERLIDTDYAKAGEQVAFADGFPILLCNLASLAEIYPQQNIASFIRRFRPNIVISGAEAFAEDRWQQIRIGEQVLDLVKPCSRCVMPAINPNSGERELDVIRKLARQRRREDGQSYFGINAMATTAAAISLGQEIEVLA